MRTITKHIIIACFAICAFLVVSCSRSDDMSAGGDGDGKTLVLRIGTVGQSRASDPDKELMHSLRIIILGRNDKVEHNFYKNFGSEVRENYTHSILNLPPGQKSIYLIANEESVQYMDNDGLEKSLHTFLEAIQLGDTDARDKINGLYFEPDYTQPIPISARHDLFIPYGSEKMERDLYMVRVATKFSVTFLNYRDDEVKIKDFTISSVADRNYLMARLNEKNPLFKEYPSWIEWLKYVSDESQKDPYNPELADQYGWVMDYELPNGTSHNEYSYNENGDESKHITVEGYKETNNPKWGETKVENIYIPESIQLKTGQSKHGEQEYTMTFDIEGRTDNTPTYTLPNLKALFRNTHVLVIVQMNRSHTGGDNFLEVRVKTWEQGDKVDDGFWEEVTD